MRSRLARDLGHIGVLDHGVGRPRGIDRAGERVSHRCDEARHVVVRLVEPPPGAIAGRRNALPRQLPQRGRLL
jgi:hypothetical protein